jgi:hypothetical protein
MHATDTELAYGYTLAQVEHLAKAAVNMAGQYASDYLDRLDAAYGAIVIALYEAPHWPTRYTLMEAGARAVHDLVRQTLHLRGYRDLSGYAGAGSSPRFATYWTGMPTVTPSPENRIVEHVAVGQIVPRLAPRERQAVTALAATGDYQAGADLLGMGYDQFVNAVNRARHRAWGLWHEHETPAGRWRKDVRLGSRTAVRPSHCPQGHSYDEANTAYKRSGGIRCKTCHRERQAARRAGTHRKQELKPCGTYAAWRRHQYHGENVDPACEAAVEEYRASRRKTTAVAA